MRISCQPHLQTGLLKDKEWFTIFFGNYTVQDLIPKNLKNFFNVPLNKVYGLEFWLLRVLGFLVKDEKGYEMTLKGAFYYHYYENFYTLSYIDKMWGLMRKEAFPRRMQL